jgi:FAD:protein FMN transferase
MDSRGLTRRAFLRVPRTNQPAAANYLVRVHREVMACRFEVVIPGEAGDQIPHAQAALDEADRLEQLMTIFRQSSELSHINATAHERPVPAGAELFGLLDTCASLHHSTGGTFDITSTSFSHTWGFLRREGRLPTAAEIAEARARVGMHLVELDGAAMSVYFRRPGVALNLGAIGKGFALDRLAELLHRRGVRHALLSAGASSVLGIGGARRPWEVDLRSMTTGGRLARLRVVTGAIGTSGAGEQFFEVDGVRYGHVIDPRSGWPATGVVSASVVTRSAAIADALSTAFFIGGISLAKHYCADHPDVLAIVTPDDEERRPMVFGSFNGATVDLA